MASSVDSRVVQMQFDNAQFEQGVQQTMSSLEKLNKSTENLQGAEKGVGRLRAALGNFSVGSAISSGLDTISSGFHTIANVGMGAFDAITSTATTGLKVVAGSVAAVGAAITGIAISGGINRAMNIEQAKFQLKGLGIAWSDIEDDINHGVKGTAYGLDSAAKAASQFAASGVEVGDSMKAALRGISGVAAMTSSDYDSIANVFTAVSGQGKVMTQQLRMLELRGMNAAASMAEYFTKVNNGSIETTDSVKQSIAEISNGMDVTEADIRDMVTKGVINFDVFSHAMDDTFGLHAKKANETFTGAMSNVKAALARIGANFATPAMEALRTTFVKLIPAIDGVNSAMKPFYNIFATAVTGASEKAQGLIEGLIQIREEVDDYGNVSYKFEAFKGPLADMLDIFSHLISLPENGKLTEWYNFGGAFKNIIDAFSDLKGGLSTAFNEVFPNASNLYSTIIEGFKNAAVAFEDFTSKLKFSKDTMGVYQTLHDIFVNLFQAFKNVGSAISGFTPLFQTFAALFQNAFPNAGSDILSLIEGLSKGFADFTEKLKPSPAALGTIAKAFQVLLNVARVVGAVVHNVIMPFGEVLGSMFLDIAEGVGSGISQIVEFLWELTGKSGGPNIESFTETLSNVKEGILEFKDAFNGVGSFDNPIKAIADRLTSFADGVGRFGTALKENIAVFNPFFDKIKEFFSIVVEPLKSLTWTDIFAGLGLAGGAGFLAGVTGFFTQFANTVGANLGHLSSMFDPERGKLGKWHDFLYNFAPSLDNALYGVQRSLTAWQTNLQAGTLIKIAGAIAITALALMALSTLNWDQLARGSAGIIALGTALTTIMAVLSVLDFKTSGAGQIAEMGVTMLLIAGAMGVLAGAIKKMGELDPNTLVKGLASTGVAIGILTGYAILLSKFAAKSMAGAMALGSMAQALILLLIPIAVLGHMDVSTMAQGIIGITALLTVLTLMASIMSSGIGAKILIIAPALMAVAAAMDILLIAVAAMGYMDSNSLVQGLLGLGGALGILALGCLAMQQAIGGAIALTVVASVMPLLAASLALLATVPFIALLGGIAGLAAAIAVFAGASALITPIIPQMFLLGAALALIGLSVALAGAGILALAIALTTLAGSAAIASGAIVTVLGSLGEGLAAAIANLVVGIIEGIRSIAVGIIENATLIGQAGVTLISALLTAAITLIPQIVQLGVTIILSLLQGIITVFPAIISAGIQMIIMFIQGIAQGIGAIIQAGFELAISFINGLADAIGSEANQAALLNAVENLGGSLLDALGNAVTKGLPDIGGKFIDGLGEFLFGKEEEVKPAAESLGQTVNDGVGESLNKLPETTSTAVDTTVSNFDSLIGGLQEKSGEASSAAFENFDLSALSTEAASASTDITESFDLSAISTDVEGLSSGISDSFDLSPLSDKTGAALTDVSQLFNSNTSVESGAKSVGTKASSGFNSGASSMRDKASSQTSSAVGAVRGKSSSGYSAGYDVGSNMGSGLYNGLGSWQGALDSRAASMMASAKRSAEREGEIKSPSRAWARIGMYMDLGLIAGMTAYQHRVEQAGRDVSRAAISSAVLKTGMLADALNGIDYNPVIRPVLDSSRLRSDIQSMNGLWNRSMSANAGYLTARSANQGSGYLNSDSHNQTVINVTLDYKAGADANKIVTDLGMLLKTRNILEA